MNSLLVAKPTEVSGITCPVNRSARVVDSPTTIRSIAFGECTWGRDVQTQSGTVYRFGPFEVNASSGELLKNGTRLKLQEQPFQLLVILLENPGEVVTREELRSGLWREDTFVDFDGSLRVAVRKLREALNDDAENPLYVETIPKRGYRFLAPVTHQIPGVQQTVNLPSDVITWTPLPEKRTAKSRPVAWIAAAALLLTFIFAVVAPRMLRHRQALTDKDTIVLADFANTTGDPVFDGTLREGIAVQLEQSPFLEYCARAAGSARLADDGPEARCETDA